MKQILIFTICIATPFYLIAQIQNNPINNELLFMTDHIGINVSTTFTKGEIKDEFGKGSLLAANAMGYKLGINYTINLSKTFGIESGINLGLMAQKVKFDYHSPEFDVPYNLDQVDKDYCTYLEFPYKLTVRTQVSPKIILFAQTGFSLRYFPKLSSGTSYGYSSEDNDTNFNIFQMNLQYSTKAQLFGFLDISLGGLFKVNNRFIQVRLISTLPPLNYINIV